MSNITISTTISQDIWKEIRDKQLKYNQLIYEGLEARKGKPILMERISKLELDKNELENRNKRLFEIIRKLEGEVHEISAKTIQ